MASSFALLTASKGSEQSQEKASLRHGIFTYGLLQALDAVAQGQLPSPLTVQQAFEVAFSVTQHEHVPTDDSPTQTPQRSLPPAAAIHGPAPSPPHGRRVALGYRGLA